MLTGRCHWFELIIAHQSLLSAKRLRQFRGADRRCCKERQNSPRFAFTKSAAINKALFAGLIN
jgi:hypothetical protein